MSKKPELTGWLVGLCCGLACLPLLSIAGSTTLPYSYTNGQAADANQVNANFTTLRDAANDNDGRLGNLETDASNADAHHSSTSSGLALSPTSVTLEGSSTALTPGQLDLGAGANDTITAAMVQTLTSGGDAESLHSHAGGGGGSCYNAWHTATCGAGFTPAYTGFIAAAGKLGDGYSSSGTSAPLYCFAGDYPHATDQQSNYYTMTFNTSNKRIYKPIEKDDNGNVVDWWPCAVCCK